MLKKCNLDIDYFSEFSKQLGLKKTFYPVNRTTRVFKDLRGIIEKSSSLSVFGLYLTALMFGFWFDGVR